MLEGLAAPGLSDFSWPWPFRQSPQTHTLGALHGLSPCVHRTGWLHRPLRPSKLRVTKPWSAELERRARGPPTPRHSLSLPILCMHRVRITVGARTDSLAASPDAVPLTVPATAPRCPAPVPRPPGPARPAPRPFGLAARPAHPGSGRRVPRSRAPAPRCLPGAASRVTHSGQRRFAPPRVRSGLTCPAR